MKLYEIRRVIHEYYQIEADSKEAAINALADRGDLYRVEVISERICRPQARKCSDLLQRRTYE